LQNQANSMFVIMKKRFLAKPGKSNVYNHEEEISCKTRQVECL